MIKTSNHAMSAWLLRTVLPVLLISLAVSCATSMRPPQQFLRSADRSSAQWLDTVVDVDIADVRVVYLPLTDAFAGMKLVVARADAPVESLRIALHAKRVTRRQALWLIAKKYGLTVTVERAKERQPPYIGISKR
jgi:hypothetical protein